MKTKVIHNLETDLVPPANKRKQGPAPRRKPAKTNQGPGGQPTVSQKTEKHTCHMMDDPMFSDPALHTVSPYNLYHVLGLDDY